jgi:hypothetical protein
MKRKHRRTLELLILRLCLNTEYGEGAAEFNLAQDGFIEMVPGYVAGMRRKGDNWWCDCRWDITFKGMRAGTAELTRSILRDPPLEVAQAEADLVADDIEECCPDPANPDDWDEVADFRAKWVHLNERVERIKREIQGGAA